MQVLLTIINILIQTNAEANSSMQLMQLVKARPHNVLHSSSNIHDYTLYVLLINKYM